MSRDRDIQKNDDGLRISRLLRRMYWFFLFLSVLIIGQIINLQVGWEPDSKLVRHFQPSRYEQKDTPERGTIMDRDGNLLAISTPLYDINMDCTVLLEDFARAKSQRKRDSLEKDWMDKARRLSYELPKVLAKDGHDADYYYELIRSNRYSTKGGRKNVPITRNIDHSTYLKLRSLPLFNEGQFRSGMIKRDVESRQYPYGSLAARVIGDVKINNLGVAYNGDTFTVQGTSGRWVKVEYNGGSAYIYDRYVKIG